MGKEPKFYLGDHCDHIIEVIRGKTKEEEILCCGEKLSLMQPHTSKEIEEKHLPVVDVTENQVKVGVGKIQHPMTEEHSIGFIYLQTKKGCQRFNLEKQKEPVATFLLAEGDKPLAVYAFCNQHGFWKTEI